MRSELAFLLMTGAVAAGAADEGPGAIVGMASVAGTDRPAAHVTLHLFERDDAKTTVVTDDEGRFRCPAVREATLMLLDGKPGPLCWAEAESPQRWSWEVVRRFPDARPADGLRKQVTEVLAQPVRTTWRKRGAEATLRVECPAMGEVDVLVRGADGAPLCNRPVRLAPVGPPFDMLGPLTVRFAGKTDSVGRCRMRWFAGKRRLQVVVPGEGYGSTVDFEVIAGAVVSSATWPLARFGSVAGRLAQALAGRGAEVGLEGREALRGACDEAGRFVLRDVLPGEHRLRLTRNGRFVLTHPSTVWVAPGGRTDDVVIEPWPANLPRGPQRPNFWPVDPSGGKRPDVDWVQGTVRDAAGRGIAGARVFVRSAYNGGIRSVEDIRSAAVDDRGHYTIRGPLRRFEEPPTVFAYAKGRPPAMSTAPWLSEPSDLPGKVDLTLADRGGAAHVVVLKNGSPFLGARVWLSMEGDVFPLYSPGRFGASHGAERAELEAIISPIVETGRDGVAHFSDLFPGLYTVDAVDRPAPGRALIRPVGRSSDASYGQARGLGVSAGTEARTTLALLPEFRSVEFQVLRPDGRPVTNQTVGLQFGLARNVPTYGFLKLDGRGIGSFPFFSLGFWSGVVRFRDTEVKSIPVEEPYYEAAAGLPLSPGQRLEQPIVLTGVRRERGSLRVSVRDAEGRPARGAVEVIGITGEAVYAASTDEKGEVRFDAMTGREYRVRGFLDGPAPPSWSDSGPFPDDAVLRGRFAVVPGGQATVTPGREAFLELDARGVGYLRGVLDPPAGRRASDYVAFADDGVRVPTPRWGLDPDSGQYLCGPILAGPARLRFRQLGKDGILRDAGIRVVEVIADEVTHADLAPGDAEPRADAAAEPRVMPGGGRVSLWEGGPETPPLSVFLPDQATPAFAAHALVFIPAQAEPVSSGFSDASGRLTWRRWELWNDTAGHGLGAHVQRSTLVVSLPGRHGATILTLEQGRPTRAVLPAPIVAEGTVTLGGRPPGARDAWVRVVAEYQGHTVIDAMLGVETTATPDGHFTLSGLTAGRYIVQAARDGIWLSHAVELVAEAGKATPQLALEIPEPGAPVTIELVDPAGRPVADEPVNLIRPAGPLASLWPASFRTDAAGLLVLRGLEAGRHLLEVPVARRKVTIKVGEAGGAASASLQRVIVRMPGP